MHRQRVITRPQAVFLVQLMRFHDLVHIQLYAQTRRSRNLYHTAFDFKRLFGQALVALLPDPVGVDGGNVARRGSRHVGEHRQRDVEVVVGVRAPGQAELMAHLRHANRALHRPEVRVCQRNVHRLQRERVPHLTPVGRDHVGGGWQPGGATELRHHFTSGEPLLCTARIFRIGQHAFKLLTDFYRLIKRPGTVRIQRDARLREALRQRGDRLCFFFTRQYAAFQLEVIKAIFFIRGFR